MHIYTHVFNILNNNNIIPYVVPACLKIYIIIYYYFYVIFFTADSMASTCKSALICRQGHSVAIEKPTESDSCTL